MIAMFSKKETDVRKHRVNKESHSAMIHERAYNLVVGGMGMITYRLSLQTTTELQGSLNNPLFGKTSAMI